MSLKLPAISLIKPTEVVVYSVEDKSLNDFLQRKLLGSLCSVIAKPIGLKCCMSLLNSFVQKSWDQVAPHCITYKVFKTELDILSFFEPKKVNAQYYDRWVKRHIEALLKMQYPEKRPPWDPEQVLKHECVMKFARSQEMSHLLRRVTWEIMQKILMKDTKFGALTKQIVDWLKFSRMTGLYLIFEFLMKDVPNPVIYHEYLQRDFHALITAIEYWNQAPERNRPYLRILNDDFETECLGGRPLFRLMYIAWKIGVKYHPSLSNWTGPRPPDRGVLDKLVKKYAPVPAVGISKVTADYLVRHQQLSLGQEPVVTTVTVVPPRCQEDHQEG